MHAIDGRLSSAQFVESAKFFCQTWSDATQNGSSRDCAEDLRWIWCDAPLEFAMHHMAPGYLAMCNVPVRTTFCELSQAPLTPPQLGDVDYDGDGSEENLALAPAEGSGAGASCCPLPPCHLYDYHIVFSASYGVPLLLARGYHPDGQPTTPCEVEHDLGMGAGQGGPDGCQVGPDASCQMEIDRWRFLTQMEHPHLHQPWFGLHPCETAPRMALLLRTVGDVPARTALRTGLDDRSGGAAGGDERAARGAQAGPGWEADFTGGSQRGGTLQGDGVLATTQADNGDGEVTTPTLSAAGLTSCTPVGSALPSSQTRGSHEGNTSAHCQRYLLSWFSLVADHIRVAAPLAVYKATYRSAFARHDGPSSEGGTRQSL
eukprot:jgi/Mesvir1/15933/Mv08256-RA.1